MKKKLLLALSLGLILTLTLTNVAHAWLVGSKPDLSLSGSCTVDVETISTVDNVRVYINQMSSPGGVTVELYYPNGTKHKEVKVLETGTDILRWTEVNGPAGTYTFKFDMAGSIHCDIELRDGVGGYR